MWIKGVVATILPHITVINYLSVHNNLSPPVTKFATTAGPVHSMTGVLYAHASYLAIFFSLNGYGMKVFFDVVVRIPILEASIP